MSDPFLCPRCNSEMVYYDQKKRKHRYIDNYKCTICEYKTVNPIRPFEDVEIITENVKLKKQSQQAQDTNRIERKAFREHTRAENAYAEYAKELIKVVNANKFHKTTAIVTETGSKSAGVIQLSDLHFNELVDLPHNKYSFEIASQRLKKYAREAVRVFNAYDVNNVLIACTGDFMNSDRRLDELLSNATNRSMATFLAVDILSQFIAEIAMYFRVSVTGVTGNEGRVDQEPGWDSVTATHNYDWTIHNMLAMRFEETDVRFMHGHPTEQVVCVGGANFLLLHGHGLKGKVLDTVTKLVGKYASREVRIDYIIFGHIHEASIGDIYARSSSLVGANAYSEFGLNLISRPSQNLFVVDEDSNVNGIKVDLQHANGKGYDIDASLSAYHAKSSDKLVNKTVVFEVKI